MDDSERRMYRSLWIAAVTSVVLWIGALSVIVASAARLLRRREGA